MKSQYGKLCLAIACTFALAALGGCDSAAKERQRRSDNLKEMGLAFHNYHKAYKQLPSAEEWRFAIAPYVETTESKQLPPAERVEDLPACFQAIDGEARETNIFAIVDAESAFPPMPSKAIRFRDILDGLSLTILLIELPNRQAELVSNENMTREQAYAALQELEPGEVAHVLMGDGAIVPLVGQTSSGLFDALVTRDGGDIVQTQL